MLKFFQAIWSKFRNSSQTKTQAASLDTVPASPISITYDEQGISLAFENQIRQAIKWGEIELIAIRIEDEFLPFPYWYVGNKDNLLRIPNDAVGGYALFFDGFSEHISGYKSDTTFEVIIEASAAIEGSFIVWKSDHPAAT